MLRDSFFVPTNPEKRLLLSLKTLNVATQYVNQWSRIAYPTYASSSTMPGIIHCTVWFVLSFLFGFAAGVTQGMKEWRMREEGRDLEDGPVEVRATRARAREKGRALLCDIRRYTSLSANAGPPFLTPIKRPPSSSPRVRFFADCNQVGGGLEEEEGDLGRQGGGEERRAAYTRNIAHSINIVHSMHIAEEGVLRRGARTRHLGFGRFLTFKSTRDASYCLILYFPIRSTPSSSP